MRHTGNTGGNDRADKAGEGTRPEQAGDQKNGSDRWLAGKLVLMVAGMFAFGYALVPLYDVLCEVTGIGGRTAETAQVVTEQIDDSRIVTVEFVTTVNEYAPWAFRPTVAHMEVHPGKLYETTFYAENLTQRDLIGQAVPSVAPGQAARYFRKTECFCFTQQVFTPGEGREMPLRFLVDRDLPAHIDTVSLAYTFFDTAKLAAGN